MIRDFFRLNGKKIKNWLLLIVILFSIMMAIIYSFAKIPQEQSTFKSLLIAAVFVVTITLLIFFLFIIIWMTNQKRRNKALTHFPFNQLTSIGFQSYEINKNKIYDFTNIILLNRINDYQVIVDVNQNTPNNIDFQILFENKNPKSDNYIKWKKVFNNDKILSAKLSFNIKKNRLKSIDELNRELIKITNQLKRENFKPYIEHRQD
ncbi:hypothetical protein [Mangrovivirga cuniculi]|uniref:Uncharacterized protein n=1 Tax=Mangrovivirga cuniculi TaxID=2715131 RepID=A0A4D7K8P2_9BACT|nr:hypothetical protein [Mangrovivirga cuniculi]QCK15648.1 hypothetical protein DCC35_13290 [Mangrovivirga cuniculi]